MKRLDLLKHLEKNNCNFHREGANHTIYINNENNKMSAIPRHREIDNFLCKKICKDLGINAILGRNEANRTTKANYPGLFQR
jgi:mRNA interferase HicA